MASPIMPNTPMPPPPMGVAGPPASGSGPMGRGAYQPPSAKDAAEQAALSGPQGNPLLQRGSGMVAGYPSRRVAANMGPNRAKGGPIKAKKYAKGGSVSSRADGCATKGKTKGKMV